MRDDYNAREEKQKIEEGSRYSVADREKKKKKKKRGTRVPREQGGKGLTTHCLNKGAGKKKRHGQGEWSAQRRKKRRGYCPGL